MQHRQLYWNYIYSNFILTSFARLTCPIIIQNFVEPLSGKHHSLAAVVPWSRHIRARDVLIDESPGNRARKSRRTLQNEVRLKVLPEQLTRFFNTFVAFKKCIIQ